MNLIETEGTEHLITYLMDNYSMDITLRDIKDHSSLITQSKNLLNEKANQLA